MARRFFPLAGISLLAAGCAGITSPQELEVRAGDQITLRAPGIEDWACDARRGRTSTESGGCTYTAPSTTGSDRVTMFRIRDGAVYARYDIEVIP